MNKRFFAASWVGVLILCLMVIRSGAQEDQGKATVFFPEPTYTFDPVFEGVVIPHDFVIQNKGTASLDVKKVEGG